MIKTVIFDIDNTLYSYDDAHKQAFSALLDYAEELLDISREDFRCLHKETQTRLKTRMGSVSTIHNRLIRYQNMLEFLHKPIYHALTMNDLYWNTLLEFAVPTEGAAETMKALKKQGISIGIGTDMTARLQFEKLRKLGLETYVDFMVSSEEAQAEKPDPAMFLLCIEKAGCAPEECLFVGDSLKKDVLGPMSVGMKAAWFCPQGNSEEKNVTMITKLTELLVLAGR